MGCGARKWDVPVLASMEHGGMHDIPVPWGGHKIYLGKMQTRRQKKRHYKVRYKGESLAALSCFLVCVCGDYRCLQGLLWGVWVGEG